MSLRPRPLFYLVNAPWFVGYAWMGWDPFQALARPHGRA
jgi:hypothetical protein